MTQEERKKRTLTSGLVKGQKHWAFTQVLVQETNRRRDARCCTAYVAVCELMQKGATPPPVSGFFQ